MSTTAILNVGLRSFRGFPRELWIVFFAILVNRMGTMGLPFLLLFLIDKRGLPPSTASVIFALYPISAIAVGPVVGRLCDKLSPITVMRASLLASGFAVAAVPFISHPIAIGACVVFWSVLSESFRPANYAFVTSLAPGGQNRRYLSMTRLAVNLGMSIGPALGGLLTRLSFTAIFVFDGATSVVGGIVLAAYSNALRKHVDLPRAHAHASSVVPAVRIDPRRLAVALMALLPAEMIFFQQQSVFPLYVTGPLKMSAFVYGLAFTLNTVLIILLEVPISTLLSRFPNGSVAAVGSLLIGLGFGSLVLAKGPKSLIIPVVLWTFGEMLFLPGSAGYIADMAPSARRGTYMGFYQMGLSLSFAIGSILGIKLALQFGYSIYWVATLFVAGVSSISLYMLNRKTSP